MVDCTRHADSRPHLVDGAFRRQVLLSPRSKVSSLAVTERETEHRPTSTRGAGLALSCALLLATPAVRSIAAKAPIGSARAAASTSTVSVRDDIVISMR